MINVYGIYRGEQCLYLGVTSRECNKRWAEHQSALKHGSHSNKALQKQYDKDNNFTYSLVDSINTDNTLLKYFYEALYNSILKPLCNKVIIEQGRNKIILQRCDENLAKELTKKINEMCTK